MVKLFLATAQNASQQIQQSDSDQHPDIWMVSGSSTHRNQRDAMFRNSLEWQQTQVEKWVVTTKAIASPKVIEQSGISSTIKDMVRKKDWKFPSNLALNRDGDEPCLLLMDARYRVVTSHAMLASA